MAAGSLELIPALMRLEIKAVPESWQTDKTDSERRN